MAIEYWILLGVQISIEVYATLYCHSPVCTGKG
jgi:hypothetical protein